MWSHQYHVTHNSLHPKNPHTLSSHPSPAPTPWCLLTVSVSHLWIFPHLDRIQQHLPHSEWLPTLSSWCRHAHYVTVWIDDSSLWGTESCSFQPVVATAGSCTILQTLHYCVVVPLLGGMPDQSRLKEGGFEGDTTRSGAEGVVAGM